jgi:hypothetical protein
MAVTMDDGEELHISAVLGDLGLGLSDTSESMTTSASAAALVQLAALASGKAAPQELSINTPTQSTGSPAGSETSKSPLQSAHPVPGLSSNQGVHPSGKPATPPHGPAAAPAIHLNSSGTTAPSAGGFIVTVGNSAPVQQPIHIPQSPLMAPLSVKVGLQHAAAAQQPTAGVQMSGGYADYSGGYGVMYPTQAYVYPATTGARGTPNIPQGVYAQAPPGFPTGVVQAGTPTSAGGAPGQLVATGTPTTTRPIYALAAARGISSDVYYYRGVDRLRVEAFLERSSLEELQDLTITLATYYPEFYDMLKANLKPVNLDEKAQELVGGILNDPEWD